MGILGIRIEGLVTSEVFEAARQLALGEFKRLLLANHPDRHASAGVSDRATARSQEISAAAHMLKSTAWFEVAHLFVGSGRRSIPDLFRSAGEGWVGWDIGPQDSTASRLYIRCPMCSTLVLDGAEHRCKLKVDHFNTKVRQSMRDRAQAACGQESPLGASCAEPRWHGGSHCGYTARGRHTW